MKNVGRIFSIIGGVLGILTGFGLVVCGVFFLLVNIPEVKNILLDLLQKAADHTSIPFMDYADAFIAGAVVSAIFKFIYAALCFVGAGLSLSCHKNKSYIASIVLNALACFNTFAVLGAIFGAIFDKKAE